MKELTRNELAVVKRTAKSTKPLRDKKAKLMAKLEEIQAEIKSIDESIEIFESPIKHLTGGFTSEEVLNGTMEVMQAVASENNQPADILGDNECGTDYDAVPFANEENN